MTDRRVTDHTSITGANTATGDLWETVDISDTTDGAGGTNKKITRAQLLLALLAEDAELNALAGTTAAAAKAPYYTSTTAASTFDIIAGAWTTFTPTMSLGFALGNATYVAQYMQVGKLVVFAIEITFGTTSTYGTSMGIALPVTAAANARLTGLAAIFIDAGVSNYLGVVSSNSTTAMILRSAKTDAATGTAAGITSTSPFTFGTGDGVAISGFYEAA